MDQLSSDGVSFFFLAVYFLYGAGLALWERDWPELAIRATISLALVAFTLLGYANELRVLDEPLVRTLFWCGLLVVSTVLACLRCWKWVSTRRPGGRSRLTRAAWRWLAHEARVRRP